MKWCNNIYILELLHNLWNLKREMVQGSERRGNEKDVREEGVKRKRIGKEKGGDGKEEDQINSLVEIFNRLWIENEIRWKTWKRSI